MASSAWKAVEPVESCNLQEIMSEEYAKGIQGKKSKKYVDEMLEMGIEASLASQSKPNSEINAVVSTTESTAQNKLHDIPDDVLNYIRNDSELSQSVDFCDSDRILAEMLQAQLDKEHDDEVNRIERHTNKDSKISVSFGNFRRQHPANVPDDSDDDDFDGEREQSKNWDRFDANEKLYRGLNKKGLF